MCEINEEWRSIKDHDGYEVSDIGRVRSLPRRIQRITFGKDTSYIDSGKILKNRATCVSRGNSYLYVQLQDENGKWTNHSVHRLVAEAFIPNPDNLPFVNHKDENGHNNIVCNLEWCTNVYNIHYGSAQERRASKQRKKVMQFSLDGTFIQEFASRCEAEKITGVDRGSISNCIRGRCKTAGGYIWKEKE